MTTGCFARLLGVLLFCALAGCAGSGRNGPLTYAPGQSSYPIPGTADDPWGPYIVEASNRFGVPQAWIRAVMHQESGGHEYLDGRPITSGAGAMGLMQLMPDTYADLQAQYGLGGDPYDPHDNILAGTGYIRQMYDKYGSPGFLAAYNAGPARVDDYLAGVSGLPAETVDYVAAITPHLGGNTAPVQVASADPMRSSSRDALEEPSIARSTATAGDCARDPDAAYDPDAPCMPVVATPATPVPAAATIAAAVPPTRAYATDERCTVDPDAAFDPDHPCTPATSPVPATPTPIVSASALGAVMAVPPPSGMAPPVPRVAPAFPVRDAAAFVPVRAPIVADPRTGAWSVQVGAFGAVTEARFATAIARDALGRQIGATRSAIEPVSGLGGHTLYRARLAGLDRSGAMAACATLRSENLPCMPVAPGA